jgi:Glycosyl hydrolases family 43
MTRRAWRAATTAVLTLAFAAAFVPPQTVGAESASASRTRWTSGVGNEAALANPSCDPETGRLRYSSRYRPPCVLEWTRGTANGGTTAPGVTATTIEVAVLLPADGQLAALGLPQALPVNQATRQAGTFADAVRDASMVFDHAGFETWGRRIEYSYVTATGGDDAAQRADAATVIAQRPFAVVVPAATTSGIGGPVFERAVADAAIVVVGYPTTKEAVDQAPYRWSASAGDDRARVQLTAEFVARQLAGRRATHAGAPELSATRRAFGVVYATGPTGVEGDRFGDVVHRVAGRRVRVVAMEFDPALVTTDPARLYQEILPGFVEQMHDAGVTTIVPFADATAVNVLMKAATNLGYAPEWISALGATFGPTPNARGWDQDQASRYFGLQSATVPSLTPAATQPLQGFQWYWGTNLGTSMGTVSAAVELLRTGVHAAGPRLTATGFSEGMCAVGAQGGAADGTQSSMRAPCRSAGLPWYEHHTGLVDASLGWWDPNATYTTSAGQTVGPGAWRFLDDGVRYGSGTFPRVARTYFAPERAVLAYDTQRERDLPPTYPCTGCPSTESSTVPAVFSGPPSPATQITAASASGAALPEDFPDPFVMRDGDGYYAYATGGSRGIVQAAYSPDLAHWTWLGASLAAAPRWATGRAIWAPSVARLGTGYVMYYAARDRASSQWCLSYATAPAANAVFVDTTSAPFVCDADRGGSIDPDVFIDRDGTPYLLWKTQAASGSSLSVVVGAPLTADGRGLAGPTRTLLASNAGWDGTIIENPAMTLGSDGYTLLYSGNSFDSDRYATGIARCSGPLGPCVRAGDGPALASAGAVLGPGGATVVAGPDGARALVFAAWTAPRVGYSAGGARSLYIRSLASIGLAAR